MHEGHLVGDPQRAVQVRGFANRLAHADERNVLERWARARGIALRLPPPEPDTCCGRGCNGCVWEGWYAAVEYWREDALLALAPP